MGYGHGGEGDAWREGCPGQLDAGVSWTPASRPSRPAALVRRAIMSFRGATNDALRRHHGPWGRRWARSRRSKRYLAMGRGAKDNADGLSSREVTIVARMVVLGAAVAGRLDDRRRHLSDREIIQHALRFGPRSFVPLKRTWICGGFVRMKAAGCCWS